MEQINWDCLNIEKDELAYNSALSNTIKTRNIYNKEQGQHVFLPDSQVEVKPFDIDEARRLLPFEKIDQFKEQTEGFQVVSYDECEQALSLSLQSRKLSKAVEKKRKEITKPHLDFQRGIKKIADAFIDELKSIENSMAEKVEAFNESRRKKSEEIGVDLQTVDSVEEGTTYEQISWDFSISNSEEIPKEYFKLDNTAVKKAVSNGAREIPGLNIFETTKQVYRVRS